MTRQFFSAARGLPGAEPAQTRKSACAMQNTSRFRIEARIEAPNFFASKRRMCFEKANFLRSVERQKRQARFGAETRGGL